MLVLGGQNDQWRSVSVATNGPATTTALEYDPTSSVGYVVLCVPSTSHVGEELELVFWLSVAAVPGGPWPSRQVIRVI